MPSDKRKLEEIERKVDRILALVLKILREDSLLDVASSLVQTIKTQKGDSMGKALSVHLSDVPGVSTIQEFTGLGGTGVAVNPIGPVVFASDNPAVATVDPSSGQLAYISAGTANISATDQGVVDAAGNPNPLTDSTVLTVNADLAESLVETLTPGVQPPTASFVGLGLKKK